VLFAARILSGDSSKRVGGLSEIISFVEVGCSQISKVVSEIAIA
jgi:hypothetical protein